VNPITPVRVLLVVGVSAALVAVQVSPPSLTIWIASIVLGSLALGILTSSNWSALLLATGSVIAARLIGLLSTNESLADFSLSLFLVAVALFCLPGIAGALLGVQIAKRVFHRGSPRAAS